MKIIDLHCDTISRICERGEELYSNSGHFDIERALKSGISVQFCAMFASCADTNLSLRQVCQQVEYFHRQLQENQPNLFLVDTGYALQMDENQHRLGLILHLEGAEALGHDMDILYLLYRLGLRSLGLTWNFRNQFADGIGEGLNAGGLSKKGRQVIREMEKLGIMLDLSHIAPRGFYDALEIYPYPALVTHANARSLCDHNRNLDDRQLKALAENGGIVGINQVSDFVSSDNKANLEKLVDHILYIVELIGVEHVALGSDFDGADDIVLPGVQEYASLLAALSQKGLSKREVALICHDNAFRVITQVLKN